MKEIQDMSEAEFNAHVSLDYMMSELEHAISSINWSKEHIDSFRTSKPYLHADPGTDEALRLLDPRLPEGYPHEFLLPDELSMATGLLPFSEVFFAQRAKAEEVIGERRNELNEAIILFRCAWNSLLKTIDAELPNSIAALKLQSAVSRVFSTYEQRVFLGDSAVDVAAFKLNLTDLKGKLGDVSIEVKIAYEQQKSDSTYNWKDLSVVIADATYERLSPDIKAMRKEQNKSKDRENAILHITSSGEQGKPLPDGRECSELRKEMAQEAYRLVLNNKYNPFNAAKEIIKKYRGKKGAYIEAQVDALRKQIEREMKKNGIKH